MRAWKPFGNEVFRVTIFKNWLGFWFWFWGRFCPHKSKLVEHTYLSHLSLDIKMAAEDATTEACSLFKQLAISKTTTIEEVVSKNYGSWRALLTLMKEIRQDDTSKFSKLDLERIANLSVGFHQ